MGLKGDDIPMMAQIITVADAFEAMTSDRSYRKAMAKEKALAILIKDKGKMFNPELVDIFVDLIRSKKLDK
jgi:HD-GYP domain-containing protein (c-di-GMP phosphodiesterase class II)